MMYPPQNSTSWTAVATLMAWHCRESNSALNGVGFIENTRGQIFRKPMVPPWVEKFSKIEIKCCLKQILLIYNVVMFVPSVCAKLASIVKNNYMLLRIRTLVHA